MNAEPEPSTLSSTLARRTLLGMFAGAVTGFAGCGAIRSDGPTPTPGKQLEISVYNYHNRPITVDVSVTQDDRAVYKEAFSVEGAGEGEFRSAEEFVKLPEVADTTITGAIRDREQTTSITKSYDALPRGYGFKFNLDGDGELGLWTKH